VLVAKHAINVIHSIRSVFTQLSH